MNSKPEKQPAHKAPKKITETYLHNSGLYYLQRFAASSGQFRMVMLRKVKKSCRHHTDQDYQACADMVEALVQKFEGAGLLNDESYARGVVNSLRRQGRSRRIIMEKLKTKGVNAELVGNALQQYDEDRHPDDGDSEMQAAAIFARRKKIGPFSRTKDDTPPEKALAAMARAGFSYSVSQKILEMDIETVEKLISP